MRKLNLVNLLGFQLGWWGLVFSARNQSQEWGLTLALLLVLIHFWLFSSYRRRDHWLLKACAIWGISADILLIQIGFIGFPPSHQFPFWLLGMWTLFPLTLPYSFHPLLSRTHLRPLLALGAALSYLAGESLGVLNFPYGALITGMSLSLVWFCHLSFFAWVLTYLQRVD